MKRLHAFAAAGGLLIAAPAAAQEKPAGNDCQNVNPLAGSLQYRLAALALRGNAQTYGAVALADDALLTPLGAMKPEEDEDGRRSDDGDGGMVVALSMNQTYGVLDIPTVEQNTGCPRELLYSYRPLDMAGVSFGLGYRSGDWGLFYSTSVTYSFLTADNAVLRGMFGASASIYSMYIVLAAPFLDFAEKEAGVVSFNADYVIGGMYDLGLVTAALGYVGSQGLYARLGGADIGGFISGLFDADEGLMVLDLELGPYDIGPVSPMVYGNRRAIVAPGLTDAEGRTGRGRQDAGAWSVAGTELRDISSMFDLRFTWMFEPEMRFSEILGAIHSPTYHRPEDTSGDFPINYRAFAGVVGLPTMRYYGIEGGAVFSGGVEMRVGGDIGLGMRLVYNDPSRLTLFPYSAGHFAFDYGLGGAF